MLGVFPAQLGKFQLEGASVVRYGFSSQQPIKTLKECHGVPSFPVLEYDGWYTL